MEKIIEKLICFKTITGEHEAIDACLEYVSSLFSDSTFKATRNLASEPPYLVLTGSEPVETWLYAHVDVVAGKDDMFTLRRDGDRFIGRGTYDMKAIVAAYLNVMLSNPAASVGLMLVSDEESGRSLSTKACIDRFITGGELIILPDGGGPLMYETGAKGALWLELTVSGKAAHGSRPFLGENAIERAVQITDDLKNALQVDNTSSMPDATTLTVSRLDGGDSINAVPDKATVGLDLRYAHAAIRETCIKKLDDCSDVTYKILLDVEPFKSDLESPKTQQLLRFLNKELEAPLKPTYSLGGSDAGYFASAGALPFVFYPNGGGHHGDDEWVSLTSLKAIAAGLSRYLESI